MLKTVLQDIVSNKRADGAPDFVIRNFLKEYLQYPVLEFIYSKIRYKNFIFTGGSCLRICYGAPRLSEDLDFDLRLVDYRKLRLNQLADDLKRYFSEKFLLTVEARCQGKRRVYLKFPVLWELGLAQTHESNLLYVKIEPQQTIFSRPQIEFTPVSAFGYNSVVKNYTLSFLFTGKIIAFLRRVWFKGDANEIDIKGRDFYDLFWYLEKGIEPDWRNLQQITKIDGWAKLKMVLRNKIDAQVTPQKLSYDLKNFFTDQRFISDFCRNYKKIIAKYL